MDISLLTNLPKILTMVHNPPNIVKTVTHSQNCGEGKSNQESDPQNKELINGGETPKSLERSQSFNTPPEDSATSKEGAEGQYSKPQKPKSLTNFGKVVILTQGPHPLLYVSGDGLVRERSIEPLSPREIVDTTGAGDSFVGGFLAALCKGKTLDNCIEGGVIAARHILKQKGCTLPTYPSNYV